MLGFEFGGIIGMIEGEALDRMGHRPFDQPCAHILGEFKTQRPRTRQLKGARDPQAKLGRIEHGIAAIGIIEQRAEARLAV